MTVTFFVGKSILNDVTPATIILISRFCKNQKCVTIPCINCKLIKLCIFCLVVNFSGKKKSEKKKKKKKIYYKPSILDKCFLSFPSHPLQCIDTLKTTTCREISNIFRFLSNFLKRKSNI